MVTNKGKVRVLNKTKNFDNEKFNAITRVLQLLCYVKILIQINLNIKYDFDMNSYFFL